jgi:hypothetical protein
VLSAICRLSLNPEACVEAAEGRFERRRASTILLAKFVPGLNAVAPPLAGICGMSLPAFLLTDGAGSLLWAGVGVGSGWALGAAAVKSFGAVRGYVGWLVFGGVLLFFAWNGLSRLYLVRKYAVPRIPPGELHRKIAHGENVLVVDLRSKAAYVSSSTRIPSAIRLPLEELPHAVRSLPPDCELVFYCT